MNLELGLRPTERRGEGDLHIPSVSQGEGEAGQVDSGSPGQGCLTDNLIPKWTLANSDGYSPLPGPQGGRE